MPIKPYNMQITGCIDSIDTQTADTEIIISEQAVEPHINKNKLLFAEGNAIKYICRHPHKGKQEDIKKAIHYLQMILERDYNV